MLIEKEKKDYKLSFLGKGSEYAIIYFKNLFLTIITLGLYYPWARSEKLRYMYQSTELDDSRFTFHGTGKELFKGFIRVYAIIVVLYGLYFGAIATEKLWMIIASAILFFIVALLLVPLALHGAARYRSSRSSWRGIHFNYTGSLKELFKIYGIGFFLTIITFGIYGSWLQVDLRQYIMKHLKFGDVSFKFKGEGTSLFGLVFLGTFLSYITLGIYTFWFLKDLYKFYVENTVVYHKGQPTKAKLDLTARQVFGLFVPNFLMIVFTFGLATPWVVVRTLTFLFAKVTLDGPLDLDKVEQGDLDNYKDATGEDFLDALDLDTGLI